jgi:hypothetical protein
MCRSGESPLYHDLDNGRLVRKATAPCGSIGRMIEHEANRTCPGDALRIRRSAIPNTAGPVGRITTVALTFRIPLGTPQSADLDPPLKSRS